MPENDAFSRDLGYLEKFFDKLEAHAATLPSDAGARLRELIAGERRTWAEIRQVIGATGAPAAAPPEASTVAAPAAAPLEPHPYTRALHQGMAQLAALPPMPLPAAEGAMGAAAGRTPAGPTASSRSFSVGSLKPRR